MKIADCQWMTFANKKTRLELGTGITPQNNMAEISRKYVRFIYQFDSRDNLKLYVT